MVAWLLFLAPALLLLIVPAVLGDALPERAVSKVAGQGPDYPSQPTEEFLGGLTTMTVIITVVVSAVVLLFRGSPQETRIAFLAAGGLAGTLAFAGLSSLAVSMTNAAGPVMGLVVLGTFFSLAYGVIPMLVYPKAEPARQRVADSERAGN